MAEIYTYYAVLCEGAGTGDGLTAVIGDGNEALTHAAAHAAVALGADIGKHIAVWAFVGDLDLKEASDLAQRTAPHRLLVTSSKDFGITEAHPRYLSSLAIRVTPGAHI